MHGGCPPALLTSGALLKALAVPPSREVVRFWIGHWKNLEAHCGAGHGLVLEEALFKAVSTEGPVSFRAAWTLALLTEAQALQVTDPSGRFFAVLNGVSSVPIQRELLRALLLLPWSLEQLEALTEWAVHAVFLEGLLPSTLYQCLKVMERRLGLHSAPFKAGVHREMLDALSHVSRGDFPVHAKKKAALLKARLSE